MSEKRKVILITDGDEYAKRTVEMVAKEIGGRCISLSHGNPTVLSGSEIVELIKKAAYDPVLVMVDDSGYVGEGIGEKAMKYICEHRDIEVLGIIAVASKTRQREWTKVDVCIDRFGELTEFGVDKFGLREMDVGKITGDTVYSIDSLHVPIVVGVGDVGKMAMKDHYSKGAPITKLAVKLILERSGYYDNEE
ncbi:stage V sporulation protein AE [Bacillus sp. JJ722]|uniref:stage V sporulation protein AE n=1 Tax=Bacillus sp. JJ722 TaxID=3122973 RepID=UPI002FFEE7CB